MSKKKILLFVVAILVVIIIIAVIISKNTSFISSQVSLSNPAYNERSTAAPEINQGSSAYTPLPVTLSESQIQNGRFTESTSPDGEYISHTYDNEQGDAGVYLTNRSGQKITATYCGYFKEWSPDSKEITVFVPYVCGKTVSKDETFELHVDGTISK